MPRTSAGSEQTKPVYPNDLPNPFQEWQAENEPRLDQFFVRGPCYDQILSAPEPLRTCFIFAAYGSGKTAYRLQLERKYKPRQRSSKTLAVWYLDPRLIRAELGTNLGGATFDQHIRILIRAILLAWLNELLIDAIPFFALSPLRRTSLISLFRHYLVEMTNPLLLSDRLREWKYNELANALEEEHVSPQVAQRDGWKLLDMLRAQSGSALSDQASGDLQALLSTINHCAIENVCVLIDNLDQFIPPAQYDEALAFLWPLCGRLLEFARLPLRFVFFLPIEIASGLVERGERFEHHPRYDLDWTDAMLKDLLHTRLHMVSNGQIKSLNELADSELANEHFEARTLTKANNKNVSTKSAKQKPPPAQPISQRERANEGKPPLALRLDDDLVTNAYGSPRQLLMLGNLLFAIHRNRPGKENLFNEDDLQSALDTFKNQHGTLVPSLHIDEELGRVLIGTRELQLSKTEFKCLVFLKHAKRKLRTKEEVWKELFPGDDTFESAGAIDTFFSRLRKKIERDPKNPVYLIVEKGRGYFLDNTK